MQAIQAGQRRVLTIVLVINALTFLLVLAAALYSGFSSLLSGGLDNLGDALAYGLSLAVMGAGVRAQPGGVRQGRPDPRGGTHRGGTDQLARCAPRRAAPVLDVMGLAAVANLIANGV